MNYYNEFDPKAAAWLRELVKAGHIPAGDVDERSIVDVQPADLKGYTQYHFFAGIGGWSYALRQAGWPDSKPVWTGSCPCQPFSVAGKGKGKKDERHLWPAWFDLIKKCHPPVVFGEQVAAAIGHGWLDAVCRDLEAQDYAVGSAVFGAHSVGAPHIRQRLYYVAHPFVDHHHHHQGLEGLGSGHQAKSERQVAVGSVAETGKSCVLEHPVSQRRQRRQKAAPGNIHDRKTPKRSQGKHGACLPSPLGVCGYRSGPTDGFWGITDWLFCRDGRWRPVEPGTFPLANGVPARVVRLRGYGNAIVPQAAEAFIRSYLESVDGDETLGNVNRGAIR